MGCDEFGFTNPVLIDVSIHAPVWGATNETEMSSSDTSFNPRTRVGCDTWHNMRDSRVRFQSTHPCGVRPGETYIIDDDEVSIHAPVWGATKRLLIKSIASLFQSTHPCGVRHFLP